MNDDDRHVFRDLVYVLFKRRLRIAFVTLCAILAAVAALVSGGIHYTASARILVTAMPGSQGAAPQGGSTTLIFSDHGQAARNQAELLRDPGALQKSLPAMQARLHQPPASAIDQVSARVQAWLRGPDEDGTALTSRLSRALSASAIGDTDVVVLRLTWSDRTFAADALNLILADTQNAISQAAEARQAMKLAETGLHEAQSQVGALDAQLAAIPMGGDAASLEREKDRIGSRLAAARTAADALRLERELARRKIDTVDQAYKSGGWVDAPDSQDAPSGAPALQQTFVTLLDKHQTLLTHLPPDNPSVKAVDQQIGHVREQNYDAVKQVYTTELAAVDDKLAQSNTDTSADEARQRDLDDRLVKLDALSQARAAAAAHAAEEQRRFEDARIHIDAVGRDVAGMRVLSQATAPARPDWPGPDIILTAAAGAGLLFGIVAALLAEAMRRTMDRPRDISRLLDIEVLARVPDLR